MKKINDVLEEFNHELKNVNTTETLEELRLKYLSKKGQVSELMKNMKELDNEQKKEFGQKINTLKTTINENFQKKNQKILKLLKSEKQKKNQIDMTLPGVKICQGRQNPLLMMEAKIIDYFRENSYQVVRGPEVDTEYYNFDALNLPKNHPARDMQDTFFINTEYLLRTHTSNSQSHILEENTNQELKIICPGRVYRRDDDDATHSHQFMQCEGLVIYKKENLKDGVMAILKETLLQFVRTIFDDNTIEIRLRSSFFPFTEPSVEVDLSCTNCTGKGCNICKQTGWIEILGAGVIHENVLDIAGYDLDKYTGFAFGIGIERVLMLKHKIEDIRHFYRNDVQLLEQFKGEQC